MGPWINVDKSVPVCTCAYRVVRSNLLAVCIMYQPKCCAVLLLDQAPRLSARSTFKNQLVCVCARTNLCNFSDCRSRLTWRHRLMTMQNASRTGIKISADKGGETASLLCALLNTHIMPTSHTHTHTHTHTAQTHRHVKCAAHGASWLDCSLDAWSFPYLSPTVDRAHCRN